MSYVSEAMRPNTGTSSEMEKREDKGLVARKATLEADGYKVGLFWIPQQKLGLLEREIAHLQRRTHRLNMKPIVFEKGTPYYTSVPSTTVKAVEGAYGGREYKEHTRMLRGEVTPVLVGGEEPRLRGWRLIACLDYDEEGGTPWLRVVPDEVLPAEYRTVDPTRCDHCLTKRDRSTVFVLANDDGTYKVVGRTCLLDFLGGHGSPMAMANGAETLFALFDAARGMEEWGSSGGGSMATAVDLEEFLARVVRVATKHGWVSRKEANDSYEGKRATADQVWDLCFPVGSQASEIARKGAPDPSDYEVAKKVIEWATKEFVDPDPSSLTDFGYNCRTALIAGIVTARSRGIVASLPESYRKAMQRLAESADAIAGHYGTVGERIVLNLDFLGAKAIQTAFGTSYLCTFRGSSGPEKGYAFKWFGSSWPFEFKLHEATGKQVRVKATIKKHGEWRDKLETELSRVQPVGPEEESKPKRTSRPKKKMESNMADPLSDLRASMRSNTGAGEDASPEQAAEMERVARREASDGDRMQINAATLPVLTVIRSKHNPDVIKIGISGNVGKIGVTGETLQVHLGIDRVDGSLAHAITPQGRIRRTDSSNGDIPSAAKRVIEQEVLATLESLVPASPQRRNSRPPKRASQSGREKRTSRTGHPGAKRHSRPNRSAPGMEEHRPGPGVMGRYFGKTVDPDRYTSQRGSAVDAAMDKYQTFHAKPPLDVVDVRHEPPARLVKIGDAHAVSYKTDKWYKDGSDIDYKHIHGLSEKKPYERGKGVLFYENATLADPADIRANGTTRPPRTYPKAWTRLGKFQGADLRRNDGEWEEVDAKTSAKDCWLLCAPDGKMLAIYSPNPQDDGSEGFLAIMCGGDLRVLKDGIDG